MFDLLYDYLITCTRESLLTVTMHCCLQEIIVVCQDSDVEFWADSESSDGEDSTDDELKQVQTIYLIHVQCSC